MPHAAKRKPLHPYVGAVTKLGKNDATNAMQSAGKYSTLFLNDHNQNKLHNKWNMLTCDGMYRM